MAKKLQHRYTFVPSTNTVIVEGNIHRIRLLLITNVTDNRIIYNFGDPNLGALSVTFDEFTESTTVVLKYDCSAMSSTDSLQIFIEEDAVEFRPDQTYTDPVSKFRISEAQTLIDTDFEYGLQSTKWETLELVNNIPGFFSRTGDTPLRVTSITANSGSSLITVNAVGHGLIVGTPFDVRGLIQPNLDGSYIINSVPGEDSFTFIGKSISVNTGTISGPYTYLIPGKFYAGSQINYDRLETDGLSPSTVTVTTTYPHGFRTLTEFYVINTLGTQSLTFDSSQVDIAETNLISQTNFDPNSTSVTGITTNTTLIRNTDIWDFTSGITTQFSGRFFKCGSGGALGTANQINIPSHGFNENDPVTLIAPAGSTVPTGLSTDRGYFVNVVDANNIRLKPTLYSYSAAYGANATTTVGIATTTNCAGLIGIQTGLAVIGTNIGSGATVSNYSLSTRQLTLSVNNIGAVSGIITFFAPITANSGTGVCGLMVGYAITAYSGTDTTLSLNKNNDDVNLSTSTPLMLVSSGAATTSLIGLGLVTPPTKAITRYTYDGTSSTLYYFGGVGIGTSVTVRTDVNGGGTPWTWATAATPNIWSTPVGVMTATVSNATGIRIGQAIVSGARFLPGTRVTGINGNLLTLNYPVQTATANQPARFFDLAPDTLLVPLTQNTTGNSIYIPSHGFLSNEPFTYSNGGGTSIAGLTHNTVYYIDYISENQFGLKATEGGSRINLTGYNATGVAHSFYYNRDNPTKNTVFATAHGLSDNTEVVYQVGGGTSVGGLVNGTTYFVRDASTDRFRLTASQAGSAINFTSVGVGIHTFQTLIEGVFDGTYSLKSVVGLNTFSLNTQSLTISKVTRSFSGSVDVYPDIDAVYIPSHRFATGTAVSYNNGGGTTIGGLTNNSTYYVIRMAPNLFKLATSASNAGINSAINISSLGSGTQSFTSSSLSGEATGIGTVSLSTDSDVVTGYDTKFTQIFKSGDPIIVGISTTSVYEGNIQTVLSDTSLKLTSDAGVSTSNAAYLTKTSLYIKSNAFGVHRPFDGGVDINAGFNADSQIVRQTRRYFRYQSGKGLASQFAINFNPPLDVMSIVASGTTATATTRYAHGLTTSQTVIIREAEVGFGTNYYNGQYTITSVPSSTSFTYSLGGSPQDINARGFPQVVVRDWNGSLMRAGMFDFQNGMFFEYDGTNIYCVRRDSVNQASGTVTATYRSNLITGSGTRFLEQFSNGDMIVLRGQSYKVVNIDSNTTMHVQPAYRGTSTTAAIISKTIDTRVSQANWSIDKCDGNGQSGYNLDVTRIQMAYMDYSWYGAGKIRFGFKDRDGEVIYVHEFKHNNRKNEAFIRSGNLPARYEIANSVSPAFAPSLAHWGTTVQMDGKFDDDDAYLFTASSSFLTFDGSTQTADGNVGAGSSQYIYVNPNGTTTTGITTFTTKTISSFDTAQETITINSHGYSTGTLVRYQTTGNAQQPLVNGNYYYVINVSTNTFRLAESFAAALAGTAINLTTAGTGTHTIRSNFQFTISKTNITGFGERLIHRFVTDSAGFAKIGNISFGTKISSSEIDTRGTAYVYRISSGTATGTAVVDFFFEQDQTNPLATTGFIPASTTSALTHTFGSITPVPDLIPIISLRLAPSVDGGITGVIGEKDIITRMQLALNSLGILTTHDVEVRLVLNGQLDNVSWKSQGVPSLSQLISHNAFDTVTGGVAIFSFRAAGNPPDSSGKRTANAFSADISTLLNLGNSILGGDGVYPDGPDILTLAIAPLNTTGITINSPLSVSGRVSWQESQA